mgnify:FL=1
MQHSAKQCYQNNFEIIELNNKSISAKIVVNIGNTLFSFKQGNELLYFPFSLDEYKTNSKLTGNPFMHPWANRLENEYIQVENKQHHFPKEQLHLLYRDGNNLPLHGLLLKSDKWKTIELYEDEKLCYHLAEFIFDDAAFLSIFPFKHKIQIKHQLQNNELKIETTIFNEDEKAMPISFGFNPYFFRNSKDAELTIPSINTIEVDDKMIPTGNLSTKENKWNFDDDKISLENFAFDDGFQDLKRNENEGTVFSLNEIKIAFDENYAFAQIYAPQNPDKPYVCIEPMTATTNALNTNSCKKIKSGEKFAAIFSIILNT